MDSRLIYERLKALSGGIEREQYRDISKAFEEVVRYNQKALDELKRQIDRELKDESERFYLYGAVTKISDAPIVNDFLFPMGEAPSSESIATIFCECSPEEMRGIFSEPQELLLDLDDKTVEVAADIRPCRRYFEQIERLKTVFYDNGLYWRTPFLPYVHRFGDVFCQNIDRDCEVRSIRFKKKEIPVRQDLIPLWNVEAIKLKCTVFPIPAIDEQNYRHTLRLPFLQDGYAALMDRTIKNVFFTEQGMEIITEEKAQKEFDLYRIAVKREISAPHYPLTTNRRSMRHIDRQADHSREALRTRAEISRIVTSYEVASGLELKGIEEGKSGSIRGYEEPYEYRPAGRGRLLLIFRAKQGSFINQDAAAFLVREVQNQFPHMEVTGEWLEGDEE